MRAVRERTPRLLAVGEAEAAAMIAAAEEAESEAFRRMGGQGTTTGQGTPEGKGAGVAGGLVRTGGSAMSRNDRRMGWSREQSVRVLVDFESIPEAEVDAVRTAHGQGHSAEDEERL